MEAKDFTLKFEIRVEGTQRQFYSENTPMRRPVFATRLN